MDRLDQVYILCSYLWNGITRVSLISYGHPVFDTPEKAIEGPYGEIIDQGVIEHWTTKLMD